MALQGLTFTSIFPGPTHPGGIGFLAQSLTWRPAYLRSYLTHMGKLDPHEYVWGDRLSMLYSASMHLSDIDKLSPAIVECEGDDDGWYRLRKMHRQPLYNATHGGSPRVWAVSIASATISGWSVSQDQWCIVRQITGGEMEFLWDTQHTSAGVFRPKWGKGRATHAKPAAVFHLQNLISFDPEFCSRTANRLSS